MVEIESKEACQVESVVGEVDDLGACVARRRAKDYPAAA